MALHNIGQEMPTINGTQNRFIPASEISRMKLPKWVIDFIEETKKIAASAQNLWELEKVLCEQYWTEWDKVYTDEGIRCANAFALPNTALVRSVDNIILPEWETPHKNIENDWVDVKDPLGWMSVNPAPTPGFWLLGKVPFLRPMNQAEYDKELHRSVLEDSINMEEKWLAIEISESWDTAIMPLFAIHHSVHSAIAEIIWKYPDNPSLIATAKHYGINQ